MLHHPSYEAIRPLQAQKIREALEIQVLKDVPLDTDEAAIIELTFGEERSHTDRIGA